jgi:hypothetical protein
MRLGLNTPRKVFPKHPGDDFWDTVDSWLDHFLKGGKDVVGTVTQ